MPSRSNRPLEHDFVADHLRPRYHVFAERGWLNDPNGLIKLDGRYHLFFQHNPDEALWGNIHWGHVSGSDLVHWTHEPIALFPESSGPDAGGCWSGSAILGPEGPLVFYTGRDGDRESICIARGDSDLRGFRKDLANPVLRPPATQAVSDFRDPRVWRDGDGWRMIVGAGLEDGRGSILQYHSSDLYRWEAMGPIIEGEYAGTAEAWECPDLFAVDGRHSLIYSVTPGEASTRYATGGWDGHTFEVELDGYLDLGPYYYAAQTLADDGGRRLVWGWLREGRTVKAQQTAGWSGALSLPRVLSVDPFGRLLSHPVPELDGLRGLGHRLANVGLSAGETCRLEPDVGHAWEGRVRFSAEIGGCLRLVLCASDDGREQTVVDFDVEARRVTLDRTISSLSGESDRDRRTFELGEHPGAGRTSAADIEEIHVFVDGSIVELFIDGSSITTRVYPNDPESTGVYLQATNGNVMVHSVEYWSLART